VRDVPSVIFVVYGAPTLPAEFQLLKATVKLVGEDLDDTLGTILSPGGDVDGDGYADLLVGGSNKAYLINGAEQLAPLIGLDSADVRFSASGPHTGLGHNVSGVGDLNGDGAGDVVITALDPPDDAPTQAGAAFLFYGPLP
jgi:hypothetical protein